ncbi:MAG TPA: co-chaperone GroES [Candidatus Paceibacterota bacterium]|nr:co-chaperone GroES [Candidatus Paceibacterota bacterium]HRR45955.1 co-chaperone GroES [Candidatus Paceibacterota bacterium]
MLKPLADYIVLEPIKEETTTESGLVLPETTEQEKSQKGKVIAVGPGKLNDKGERIPVEVKIGDIVLFHQYGPSEIKIDKKEYLVAKEDDIVAIIE